MTETEKLAWGATLKVGDVVCDCRYKHIKIASVEPEIVDGRLVDYHLVLEDGANCSVVHCCDPADHAYEHPPVKEPPNV